MEDDFYDKNHCDDHNDGHIIIGILSKRTDYLYST